jgi:hypothetical protein
MPHIFMLTQPLRLPTQVVVLLLMLLLEIKPMHHTFTPMQPLQLLILVVVLLIHLLETRLMLLSMRLTQLLVVHLT